MEWTWKKIKPRKSIFLRLNNFSPEKNIETKSSFLKKCAEHKITEKLSNQIDFSVIIYMK